MAPLRPPKALEGKVGKHYLTERRRVEKMAAGGEEELHDGKGLDIRKSPPRRERRP